MNKKKLSKLIARLAGFTAIGISVATTLVEGDIQTRTIVGVLLAVSILLLAYEK